MLDGEDVLVDILDTAGQENYAGSFLSFVSAATRGGRGSDFSSQVFAMVTSVPATGFS